MISSCFSLPYATRVRAGLVEALPGYCTGLGGMLATLRAIRVGSLDRAFCDSLGGHHAYPAQPPRLRVRCRLQANEPSRCYYRPARRAARRSATEREQ